MSALSAFEAAILGLVEGITEFLPVSSTGHLIIVSRLLGLSDDEESARSINAFNFVIQGGAILAVVGLYRERIVQILRGLAGRDPLGLKLAINLFIAFVPAAVLGLLLNDWLTRTLFHPLPVLGALGLGGVLMLFVSRWQRTLLRRYRTGRKPESDDSSGEIEFLRIDDLSWRQALAIGVFQCVALWPGTSRSMMTIVGGMLAGMRPRHAAEFSFLLGLPTLGGACLYSAVRNFGGDQPNMFQTLGIVPICVGLIVATASAVVAVRWLVAFLNRHGLAAFGWYRIVLCIVMIVLLWRGWLTIEPEAVVPARPATAHTTSENDQ